MTTNFNDYLPSGAVLHEWQEQFLDKFIRSAKESALVSDPDQREAFVLNAFPAAGKTWAQMVAIKHLIEQDVIDIAVVVVPSVKLKTDFGDEAQRMFGLMTHNKTHGGLASFSPRGTDVLVITYGQLATNQERLQEVCANYKVMVSADEMHHMSERASWGTQFMGAFDASVVRLLTTGTPFRSDGVAMPWVRVTADNTVDLTGRHAYSYPYGQSSRNPDSLCALLDNVAAPVVFHPWDGEVEFSMEINGEERVFKHALSDNLDLIYGEEYDARDIAKLKSIRREFALECGTNSFPHGTEYVRSQIKAAHKRLMKVRNDHPHASGMIVCKDCAHADAIARVVEELTGTDPVIVHGNEPDYQKQLLSFQEGYSPLREPWLISVNMVSEGVNINHLRVLVYMTNITAPMRWTQIIGRVIRFDKTVKDLIPCQEGHVFQYDDGVELDSEGNEVSVRLKLYAETLLEEKEFTIKSLERAAVELERRLAEQEQLHPGEEGASDEQVVNQQEQLLTTLRNLGASGEQTEQLFEGVRHQVKDLELFEPLTVGWKRPPVICKQLVDDMPPALKEQTYSTLRLIHSAEEQFK